MKFDTDNQTVKDLHLFSTSKGDKSVFSLFDQTKTWGGRARLRYMFSNPFGDKQKIGERIMNIKFFLAQPVEFELNKEKLYFIELYLSRGNRPLGYSILNSFARIIFYRKSANEKYIIKRGIRYLISLISDLYLFFNDSGFDDRCRFFDHNKAWIIKIICESELKSALAYRDRRRLLYHEYQKLDYYFRNLYLSDIRRMLEVVYEIDALKSVSSASVIHGFSLPVLSDKKSCIEVRGLYHPFLKNPVVNNFSISPEKNICFLTGPNMAGKSTFLKAVSICVYLAHIGFPVPAQYLKTSVYSGLFTTINLPDSITQGYSHFYSEVLRVKQVAQRFREDGNIFVVFDEMFRGTNVKDALEASLAVIQAFSKLKKGAFAISTHIIEIAEKLSRDTVFFKYFDAGLVEGIPHYSYKLKDGITDERIGMYILKKEKVIETIEGSESDLPAPLQANFNQKS